ncbi:MAG: class II aldolase/adducin family protein [Clostridia bacterium]|nr:class II aldolase/adducin family protein [Clostridia bacterium]
MDIQKAKEIVVEAGKQLVSSGLIARTWGNVSCRVDDKTFVITPSGRAYETLTPDEVVLVNMADLSYEGNIKPSSEKGIHASCYMLRPDCNFVIHTHQTNASIVSALGCDINNIEGESKEIIGDNIPVSAYGLSGTGTLRKNVIKAIKRSDSKAVIMKNHGAVCLGADYDDAFKVASEVEKVCAEYVFTRYSSLTGKVTSTFTDVFEYVADLKQRANDVPDVTAYDSSRNGNIITIKDKDGNEAVTMGLKKEQIILGERIPSEADMHLAIYRERQDINYIIHSDDESIVAASKVVKKKLRPLIDDFAQIAGVTIQNVEFNPNDTIKTSKKVVKALGKNKTVALIRNNGAVCCGSNEDEASASEIVAAKNCKTFVATQLFDKAKYVGRVDALLENVVYRLKYSKQK